jgi:plastocyanin
MNKEGKCMRLFLVLIFISTSVFSNETKIHPTRELAVIVTKEGYYPKSLSVFEGERIKFYLTSTVEEPSCLIVESHKVFLAANKGKVTEGEAIFDKAGEYSFYCPSSKNDGKIVVIKKAAPKREVASERNREGLWTPKEY